ncbi:gamma-glutamyltransferase [Sphingomonas carotinifaciens]|uniref:Glutathione hydrolase proenzyme n=2 Tax=Sphingomonas carotinifaciens TaxID=1166323 RepID=A0A1G7FIB3_9SPHN|nr:gamma-glutamyltranspeptidase/glutathione hydrolase [Sphingomonas carotinifaciens]SDE75557.1 gamma-glutamyltranspeptidase / glutathione hydrolase [Sphingomonas carotinifaciens]
MKTLLLAAAALALPATASARTTTRPVKKSPVTQGMVSAADPRAAQAGVDMLRMGGTATDAAIATMLVLNVVEPQNSGIGGGSFWVSHAARTARLSTIDAREAAPAAADPRWFYAPDGTPLSHRDAVPGGRSVGVPGALRGMAVAHRRSGKLAWKTLFGPAIRLAREGFTVSERLRGGLIRFGTHVDAATRARFSGADGQPLPVGATVRVPDQAALFERLAAQGADSFYVGPQAQKIVTTVNTAARNPSRMTTGDLATYDARPRPPICGSYRAYRICGMGPPSAGGVAVLMILKQLERFDMAALGPASATAWHLFAESSRLAYADRDMYLADPDYVQVPVKGLLSPGYLATRSALIAPDRTMASVSPGTPPGAPPRVRAPVSEVPGTSDLAAVDAAGNAVQVTTTIEGYFGSGLSVDGISLNNELTDFDIVPVEDGRLVANRVEGGKRPRSSMSPTIVYDPAGRVRLAVGAAGGSTIIAQVAKAIIGVIDWKLSAQDAIGLGLVYAPGQVATVEKGTTLEPLVPRLRALGEQVRVAPLGLKANAIERVNGRWVGAADPRSEGVAIDVAGNVTRIRRQGSIFDRPAE